MSTVRAVVGTRCTCGSIIAFVTPEGGCPNCAANAETARKNELSAKRALAQQRAHAAAFKTSGSTRPLAA